MSPLLAEQTSAKAFYLRETTLQIEMKTILLVSALPKDNSNPWSVGYEFGVWTLTRTVRDYLLKQMVIAQDMESKLASFANFELFFRPEVKFIAAPVSGIMRRKWFFARLDHVEIPSEDVDSVNQAIRTPLPYDCAWLTVSSDSIVLGFGVARNERRVWMQPIDRDFLEALDFD